MFCSVQRSKTWLIIRGIVQELCNGTVKGKKMLSITMRSHAPLFPGACLPLQGDDTTGFSNDGFASVGRGHGILDRRLMES